MTNTADALAAVELAWSLPEGRTLTDAERTTLTAFTGWGALAPAFNPAPAGAWLEVADRLDTIVPAAALTAARRSTPRSSLPRRSQA